ncbi:sigma-70 family RNA polymerase sigma factor [Inconstantimicrobium mannanitabidum]|uniref:Uncharacterized protein n=1 Tax=Inconstantimicrobium mannanitabidum TaxID=1604901 RepID=A0ACB5RIR5_9CLOT|nr:sigma-70 family RNA polymerase sigma factor [Clostridium sp. TW13]GKX68976.1 hypothetical protein rsdtw13_42340 [Clostridium sp. TW13]
MDHKQIEQCVIKAKEGDNEAILMLLDQYKPFIFKTANKYYVSYLDIYDLAQTAYVALINSIDKYKIGSNTFSSYAFQTILNAILDLTRHNIKHSDNVSLNERISNEGNAEFIECLMSQTDIEDDFIRLENFNELRSALSKLSEDEFELIFLVYYNGVSMKTYAERKNMEYFRAIRKRNKILRKLKMEIRKVI